MAARVCDQCQRAYRPGTGRTRCPACDEPLSYSTSEKPDTPWPGEPLPPLDPETEQIVARGWHELKDEAERRGVSPADVLELKDWAA